MARHIQRRNYDPAADTTRRNTMNWDQVEGKWKEYKGKVKEKWGKLTDDDLDVISGKRDQLVGKLQARYGTAKEEAQKQADEFVNALNGNEARAERTEHREEKYRTGHA